jgi:hypothetical protein
MGLDINIHHHHHFPPAPADPRLDLVLAQLQSLKRNQETRMSALDDAITDLTAKVTALTSVDEAAVTLIDGIAAEIQAAVDKAVAAGASAEQLAALNDLSAKMDSDTTSLGRAVAANTPQPTPAPGPAPDPTPAPTPSA